MTRAREVDDHGNFLKCGGVHYGTGYYCVYEDRVASAGSEPSSATATPSPNETGAWARCREALRAMLEWFDSAPVQQTFSRQATLTLTHKHLAMPVTPEFSAWAGNVIGEARAALAGASPTEELIASLRSVLAPLQELAAKATRGPWRDGDGEPFHEGGYAIVGASPLADPVAYRERILFRGNAHFEDCADNVRLVVALRNALPALLKIAGESAGTEGAAPEAIETSKARSAGPAAASADATSTNDDDEMARLRREVERLEADLSLMRGHLDVAGRSSAHWKAEADALRAVAEAAKDVEENFGHDHDHGTCRDDCSWKVLHDALWVLERSAERDAKNESTAGASPAHDAGSGLAPDAEREGK